jgi:hypothetical protein
MRLGWLLSALFLFVPRAEAQSIFVREDTIVYNGIQLPGLFHDFERRFGLPDSVSRRAGFASAEWDHRSGQWIHDTADIYWYDASSFSVERRPAGYLIKPASIFLHPSDTISFRGWAFTDQTSYELARSILSDSAEHWFNRYELHFQQGLLRTFTYRPYDGAWDKCVYQVNLPEPDHFELNGLRMPAPYDKFVKKFGKPDSMHKELNEVFWLSQHDDSLTILHYGKSSFVLYTNEKKRKEVYLDNVELWDSTRFEITYRGLPLRAMTDRIELENKLLEMPPLVRDSYLFLCFDHTGRKLWRVWFWEPT